MHSQHARVIVTAVMGVTMWNGVMRENSVISTVRDLTRTDGTAPRPSVPS